MRFRSKVLTPLGITIVALFVGLRQFLQRSNPPGDVPDFALGMLVGIGLGLLILGIWRNGPTGGALRAEAFLGALLSLTSYDAPSLVNAYRVRAWPSSPPRSRTRRPFRSSSRTSKPCASRKPGIG
jgi:hypothetical protein